MLHCEIIYDEIEVLDVMSLLSILRVAHLVPSCTQLIMLAKRLDLDTNTFHLSTDEMMVALKDVTAL